MGRSRPGFRSTPSRGSGALLGVDMVEVARLRRTVERHPAFLQLHFTEEERTCAESLPAGRRFEFLAGRFAAKEAALKALGTGISGGVLLSEVETLSAASGAPVLRLHGAALKLAEGGGVTRFEVSISHDGGFAVAVVLLS